MCPTKPSPSSPSDCSPLSTGYFADTSSRCRRYFFCQNGHKLITLTCSDERVYNGHRCVEPYLHACQSTPPPPPPVNVIASDARTNAAPSSSSPAQCPQRNGFFAVAGSQCQRYYFCIGNVRSDLKCADQRVFNGELCVDRSRYDCPESLAAVATPAQQQQPAAYGCQGQLDGVYVDQSRADCRHYYLCQKGVQTDLSCPLNHAFDGRRCSENRGGQTSCGSLPLSERTSLASAMILSGEQTKKYEQRLNV